MRSILFACLVGTAVGFNSFKFNIGGGGKAPAAPRGASKEATDNAIAAYNKKWGKARPGTRYSRTEAELSSAFNQIAAVYGEDNATKMVDAVPDCLSYNPANFKPSFDAFVEALGEDDAKGMVTRNPNLLAVPPTGYGGADKTGKDALYLSYVIAATRPLGPVLLATLFFLLSVPAIEIATGIPREEFLDVIQSKL